MIRKARTIIVASLLVGLLPCAAQTRFQIADADTVFVLPSATMATLESADAVPLSPMDVRLVNDLLRQANGKHKEGYFRLGEEGIFVDVYPKDGGRRGCCIGKKRFTLYSIDPWREESFRIPRRLRGQMDSLVAAYRQTINERQGQSAAQPVPLASVVFPRNMCVFNPQKNMINVSFDVCVDSARVIPVEYDVFVSKKSPSRSVAFRLISIWSYLPALRAAGREVSPDGLGLLTLLFPNWSQMSEQEKMSALDAICKAE